jgi:hypothetical protein
MLPRLAIGRHQLLFRNHHRPDGGAYLANALVPASDDVSITAQRRDGDQTELTIEYELRAASPASSTAWLLTGLAVATALSVMRIRRTRSVT